MGRPKKEKAVDPILAGIIGGDTAVDLEAMPALSPTPAPVGDNAVIITEDLARGVKQLRLLDREIAMLNLQKSGVFATLAERGYSKKLVKAADKKLRIDPVMRARLKVAEDAYVAALEAGFARLKAEAEKEAADATAAEDKAAA